MGITRELDKESPMYSYTIYTISCDHSHIPLHYQRKEKENQKKRNIKSRKIDKRKRKRLVSKHTKTDIQLTI